MVSHQRSRKNLLDSKRGMPLLQGLPSFFNCLSESELRILSESYIAHEFKKGSELYRANSTNIIIVLVRTGLVASQIYDEAGNAMLVHIAGPNSLVFPGYGFESPGVFDTVGVSPGFALIWPASEFKKVLGSNAVFSSRVLELVLNKRQQDAVHWVRARSCSLEKRLALFYWNLSDKQTDSTRYFSNTISQKAIATFLGTSREEVSRKTSLLEKAGYLRIDEEGITIDGEMCRLLFFSSHHPVVQSALLK